jgi:AGZA family xanthine/uracil permease-like MFS transporter
MGVTEYKGIFSLPPNPEPIMFKFDVSFFGTMDFWIVMFTLLFVDMFDTIGTLLGVGQHVGMVDKKTGKMPWMKKAFMVDAISTTAGAMIGSSTVTTFTESTSGIAAGGRTGLTSFTTACCFALSLFLSPLFLSMPGAATAPVLILVGSMMLSGVAKINFNDFSESVPSILCITIMAFACSIADGIALGLISYVGIKLLSGEFKKVSIATYILTALFILKFII